MDKFSNKSNFVLKNLPFLIFFGFFAILAWDVTSPMATPIIWAALLSFVSRPVFAFFNEKLFKGKCASISSALTIAVLLLICVVPLIYIASSLGSEAARMGVKLAGFFSGIQNQALSAGSLEFTSWVPVWLSDYIKSFLKNSEAVKNVLRSCAQWSARTLSILSGAAIEQGSAFLLNTMITLMVSFFFIRDGGSILAWIKSILPLSQEESDTFAADTISIMDSIIFGAILTVAAQALLGVLGWWFVGLGSPALFGLLMFFFGMFPMGTAIVWVPGAIYLALTGDNKNAIILFVWGVCVVSVADNVLRPFLISGGKGGRDIPTLLIILGLFGGVIEWGFLGIFIGPLVLVLFVAVCELYKKRWAGQ